MSRSLRAAVGLVLAASLAARLGAATRPAPAGRRLPALKREAAAEVEKMQGFSQRMVDSLFSFGELGFQEVETSRYLVAALRDNGFQVREGYAGVPTAWVAAWGSGKPVISLGSDLDGIPKASQKPGVAWHAPLVEGAPGHGEGHNSGQAVNITAAIAVKKIMEREHLSGTLVLWPGVAEELLGTKAYFVREGLFKDADVVLFSHVDSDMKVTWGQGDGSGLVSVEYTFHGEPAHAGVAPWRGRSALDAVELMDAGWNYRREHLRPEQRSHYVITRGGDQPNVVPSLASVWYYFRELDYPHIQSMFEAGNAIAKAAAAMTETTVEWHIQGAAWPQHFNRPVAEAMHENMAAVGMPAWSDADQTLAKGLQRELKGEEKGLETQVAKLEPPPGQPKGGGSDDIGDVSWNVPTVTLLYPANIPGLPGHHWANAVAMATPIAHQGVTAGAKVQAMTVLDLLLRPELVAQAWTYFRDVQTRQTKYTPLIGPGDAPAIERNRETMDRYRPEMRKYYFDPARYRTYLEQLGIAYPTVQRHP
ncbi:MAG: amidohydrolase [Acidobacteria bacterium]|nr:MAG: amidohydrolase [Acidobacteriota bacterium]